MIKIGISQIDNHFEVAKNVKSILRAMKFHADRGVNFVLFPECAITGYNTGILKAEKTAILSATNEVQKSAKELKINVALPTPWPAPSEGLFNSVLLISDEGVLTQSVHKIDLQKGEERLFKSAEVHSRIFEIKGHKVGVIICVETSHEPWAYLKKMDKADFLFWPGFYAASADEAAVEWKASASESDRKVRDNLMNNWQVPLIHVNCSSSPEARFWPGKLFGGSIALNKDGHSIYAGVRASEEYAILEFSGGNLTLIESTGQPFS